MKALQYLIIISLLGAAACGQKEQQPAMQGPPPVAISIQPVTAAETKYFDEYPATVVALQQVELRPQVNGYLTEIHFTEGGRVKKGQKLYSIDGQLYEAAYRQAIASLQVQEANLQKAQKDADRYHELDKQDAIAKQQVDNADAALEAAKKQVEAAKANIRSLQTNVKYTTITAPFDGVIGISLVKPGAAVSAGQTVLNTISSDNPLAVDFTIDQKEIFRFTQLLNKGTKAGDSTFTIAFGKDLYPYTGKISLMDRAVDVQTGTIKTRVIFPNTDNLLRVGMTGTMRVQNKSDKSTIVIPYKAVTEQLGEYFVYVVHGATVTQKKVVLGKQVFTNIIIKEGLALGDTIATEGVQKLKEGAAIVVAPAGGAPAEAKK